MKIISWNVAYRVRKQQQQLSALISRQPNVIGLQGIIIGTYFFKVKIDKKNICFRENEFREWCAKLNNLVIFSGKPIGSERFLNQMVEALEKIKPR